MMIFAVVSDPAAMKSGSSIFIAPDGTGFDSLEFRNYYTFVLAKLQDLENRWLGLSFETVMIEVVTRMKKERANGLTPVFACETPWSSNEWPEGYLQHELRSVKRYARELRVLLDEHPRLEFLITAFRRRLRCTQAETGREYRDVLTKEHANDQMVCYRNIRFESVFAQPREAGSQLCQ
jgi:hypothetical protein